MKSFDGTDRAACLSYQAENQVEIWNVHLAVTGFSGAGDGHGTVQSHLVIAPSPRRAWGTGQSRQGEADEATK